MPSHDPLSRRSFLAAGVTAGLGAAAARLRAERGRPPERWRPGVVTHEPPAPPDHRTYVSRPDLTPPGVTVRWSEPFALSPMSSMYLFCAPKPPTAANPGWSLHRHPFPTGATPGLMILDTLGELVWFKPLPEKDRMPFNFRVQHYGGRPVLTWFEGTVHGGHATDGRYVLADSSYRTVAEVTATEHPCDLHEFIITPEGTALHTAYEPGVITAEGVPVIVGHAQEVDIATNELLFDWPCYPAVAPELSYLEPYGDYFHINSIDLWPGRKRHLLVSSRNTCAVYLVDRRTKRVIWRLGGKRSNFAFGPDADFYFQHDARPLPDGSGVSLFDDASQPCPERASSGKVLMFEPRSGIVKLVHQYLHTDRRIDTPSQGNLQRVAGGGHVVGWGFEPFFSVYAESPWLEAPLVLDGRLPEGASSYRTFLFDWSGNPEHHELRIAVRRSGSSGNFTAWVSWNGATKVASWLIRAGRSDSTLVTVAASPKRGFETAVPFAHSGAKAFQVVALDLGGDVLGRSEVVRAD